MATKASQEIIGVLISLVRAFLLFPLGVALALILVVMIPLIVVAMVVSILIDWAIFLGKGQEKHG